MLPSNYRTITISVTFSKLLEYNILDCCSSHVFSASQFGFAASRGTYMTSSLAHDLCMYAQSSGSTLLICSLDAQGAFDCLLHTVLLQKVINVIPDRYWSLLHTWYFNMCIYIRWKSVLSAKINVKRGTKQGSLTSPFIFNLFYQELINDLNPLSPKIDFYVDLLICATSWASNHKFMLLSKIFQETYYL